MFKTQYTAADKYSLENITEVIFQSSKDKTGIEVHFKSYKELSLTSVECMIATLKIVASQSLPLIVVGKLKRLSEANIQGPWYAFSFLPADPLKASQVVFYGLNNWSNIQNLALTFGFSGRIFVNKFFKIVFLS